MYVRTHNNSAPDEMVGVADPEQLMIETAACKLRSALKSYHELGRDPATTPEAMAEWARNELQMELVAGYLMVADSSTFQITPPTFRMLFLDARGDIVRHDRVVPIDVGMIHDGLCQMHLVNMEPWRKGEIGEKYKPDGSVGVRLYQRGIEIVEQFQATVGLSALKLD